MPKDRNKTQIDSIREHLIKGGTITPLEALHYYGCFRLASVINRLREEGMDIITNFVENYSDDEVKKYAEYHIRTIK